MNIAAGEGATGGVNVGELVRLVREAPLSRNEIQILTDALLNRHHDPLPQHSEWTEVCRERCDNTSLLSYRKTTRDNKLMFLILLRIQSIS